MLISRMAEFASGLPATNKDYLVGAAKQLKITPGEPYFSTIPSGNLGPFMISGVMTMIADGHLIPHHVSKQFGVHLQSVKLDVKAKYLKPAVGRAYYFEFPEFHGYKGACLAIGATPEGEKEMGDIFIAFTYFGDDFAKHITWMRTPLFYEETIEQAIERTLFKGSDAIDPSQAKHDVVVAKYFANLVLYVESGKPDLQRVIGKECKSSQPKKQRNFTKKFLPFDITRVGYNTHHSSTPSIGHTVSGHFRWQPWGVQWSKLKLIWIEEYFKG